MKKNTLGVLLAALVLGTPLAASADPSYNYFELGLTNGSYEWSDTCTFTTDTAFMSGVALRGSFALGDNFFVDGSYDGNSINALDFISCAAFIDYDSTNYTIAGGWHNENWYLKGGLEAYEYYDGVDDSGFMVDAGYRGAISDAIEWSGHLGYSDVGDLGSAIKYGLGFSMLLGDSWGVSFNYDLVNWSDIEGVFDENSTAMTIKARFVW